MKLLFIGLAAMLLINGCGTISTIKNAGHQPGVSSVATLSISPYPKLKARIDSALPDSLFPPASLGIKVVSLSTGETLYALNSGGLFMPASNEKLFTSATTLVDLGKEFRFRTTVSVDRNTSRLFIKGSGDPLLTTADLDSLARVISTTVATDSPWTLTGDVSYFDDIPWGKGWMWDDEGERSAVRHTVMRTLHSLNGRSFEKASAWTSAQKCLI